MKRTLFVLMLILLMSGCQSTQYPSYPDWQLIYSHDKQGSPIAGDKAQLIKYAVSGRPVRIVWPITDNFTHVADAGFLTVMNGELFAQTTSISRQIPDRETRSSIALDATEQSRWQAVFSTTGEIQSFQTAKGDLRSNHFSFQWYVLAPVKNNH